jgi:hypothetical protein
MYADNIGRVLVLDFQIMRFFAEDKQLENRLVSDHDGTREENQK